MYFCGMKYQVFILSFFLSLAASMNAQNVSCAHCDSISIDTTFFCKSHIQKRAEAVLESVFKPEPSLNNADSLVKVFDDLPSFGIYKNNYIVTGTTIGHRPTRENSDAKFQISVMQKLTNSVLPFKTYLFLTYTQLAYWDIYRESFPFSDLNFNPTVGLGKVLVHKNRFLGIVMAQLEHESNGKDKEDSRSWNKFSVATVLKINRHWTIQPKLWIPFVDGENNPDIVSYKGWGQLGVDYNRNERFNVGLLLTKRAGNVMNYNVTANVSYRLFKKENQHLFLEYFCGYGENMLFYKEHRQRIRVGFVIQPSLMRIY